MSRTASRTATLSPTLRLSNGRAIPQFGLGTWPMDDTQAARTVATALDLGYRLIDTAENYGNERGVGEGVRQASIPREEIFVTTKFNRQWHSVEGVRQACEQSLARLGLDYIDLLLIHWPNPDQDRYVPAFEGLVRLQEQGKVRAIGTSNFKTTHLQRLFDAGLTPHLNQIQLDPYHRRDDIAAIDEAHRIVTQAWSPLGRGGALLHDPVMTEMAQRLSRTPGQVVLRWHVQHGYAMVAKSSDPARLAENLDIFNFTLDAKDMAALDGLDRPDPDMPDSDTFGH